MPLDVQGDEIINLIEDLVYKFFFSNTLFFFKTRVLTYESMEYV